MFKIMGAKVGRNADRDVHSAENNVYHAEYFVYYSEKVCTKGRKEEGGRRKMCIFAPKF